MKTNKKKTDSMKFNEVAIIEKLETTSPIQSEASRLADDLSYLKPEQYDYLLNKLTQEFEGPALANLLIVSAINKVKLHPEYLAKSIKIVADVNDVYFAYKYQDKNSLQILLDTINSFYFKCLNSEICPLRIAVELSLKFKKLQPEVKQAINLASVKTQHYELVGEINNLKKILKDGIYGSSDIDWKTDRNPLDELPKKAEDIPIMPGLSPWHLGKLDPKMLDENQLAEHIEHAVHLRFLDKAYDFLLEFRDKCHDVEEVDYITRFLYNELIVHNNLALTEKVEKLLPEHFKTPEDEVIKHFMVHPQGIENLERLCVMEIENQEVHEFNVMEFLRSLKNLTALNYPALDIILGRATIASYPKNIDEIEPIMKFIKYNRIKLGLDPEADPVNDLCEMITINNGNGDNHKTIIEKNSQLRTKIKSLKFDMARIVDCLKEKEKVIKRLEDEIESWKKKAERNEDYQTLKNERDQLLDRNRAQKTKKKNFSAMINEEKEKNRELRKQQTNRRKVQIA